MRTNPGGVAAIAAILAPLVLLSACSRSDDDAAGVATPTVTLGRTTASIGSPMNVDYSFAVAPDAPPFAEDYVVFVHFVSAGGELMWTDDHQPPTPTRQWKPGDTIRYSRTIFVPKFPYVGEAFVQVGLYSPQSNVRLPLSGTDVGGRAYRVATLTMALQAEANYVVFREGWHDTEVSAEDRAVEWRWSRKEGVLTFRNPKRDVDLMLRIDQPALADGQQVEIRIGGVAVDTFTLRRESEELRRIPLSAAQLGTGDTVEVVIAVDRTFVPASIPELRSGDARELGARVFNVHVEPK
jgi:hypothetical protein